MESVQWSVAAVVLRAPFDRLTVFEKPARVLKGDHVVRTKRAECSGAEHC